MGGIAKLLVLIGILSCSCTNELPKYKKSPNEFQEYYQGREKWLVDTLFYGVSSLYRYRTEHAYVIVNDSGNHQMLAIYRNDSVFVSGGHGLIYEGEKLIDSLTKPKVIDKRSLLHTKDIIDLFDDYGIYKIWLPFDRTGFYVDFCYRGDTAISMKYSKEEGWSTHEYLYPEEDIKTKF